MIDPKTVAALAGKELRDAARSRWLLLYAVAFVALSLALAWLGLSGLPGYGMAGFGRTAASLVDLVLLIVPLMGLTLGAVALAGERERGTLLVLLAQPVTPGEILAGKFVGLGLALAAALGLGFGVSAAAIAARGGAASLGAYLGLAGLALLLALASLALGLLVSAALRGAAVAVGLALFLWLLLVFFGDLGVMGGALALKLSAGQLLATTFANPLQVFKVAAVLALRGSLEVLGPAGLYATRTYGAGLVPLLLGTLAAWTALPLGATYVLFRRRGAL